MGVWEGRVSTDPTWEVGWACGWSGLDPKGSGKPGKVFSLLASG